MGWSIATGRWLYSFFLHSRWILDERPPEKRSTRLLHSLGRTNFTEPEELVVYRNMPSDALSARYSNIVVKHFRLHLIVFFQFKVDAHPVKGRIIILRLMPTLSLITKNTVPFSSGIEHDPKAGRRPSSWPTAVSSLSLRLVILLDVMYTKDILHQLYLHHFDSINSLSYPGYQIIRQHGCRPFHVVWLDESPRDVHSCLQRLSKNHVPTQLRWPLLAVVHNLPYRRRDCCRHIPTSLGRTLRFPKRRHTALRFSYLPKAMWVGNRVLSLCMTRRHNNGGGGTIQARRRERPCLDPVDVVGARA